jgi:MFS family permease
MKTDTSLSPARWATFTMFVANGFGFGAWATAIAPLKGALSLSAASLSYALLAMTIGGVLALQPASLVIQRLGGTGRATRLASIAFALALALPTLSPNLPALILAGAVLGAAMSLMDVAMNAHASCIERDWGAAIMSSFHAGFSLGGLAGTGFGALLLTLGTPTPFLMLPVAVMVLLLAALAIPRLGSGDRHRTESGSFFRLPERSLIAPACILLFCLMIEGAMADWSGIYLTTIGETPARAAAGYGAFSATMVGGRLFGDAIVRRFGRKLVIAIGTAAAAAGLVLATALPLFGTVVAGFALVGAGLSNVVPCVFSAAAARASSPAAGIAEVSTAGFGGLLSGPPLIGAVAAHWNMRSGIGVIALAALAAVAISLQFKSEDTKRN